MFTDAPFEGNQLAVLLGAHDIPHAAMPLIVCELNLPGFDAGSFDAEQLNRAGLLVAHAAV